MIDRLLKISDLHPVQLSRQTKLELEDSLRNVDPGRLEECEKICAFSPETRQIIRELMPGPDCCKLKDKIIKLFSIAKKKDLLTDSDPIGKRLKLENKIRKCIEKITFLLDQRSENARNAYIFLSLNYFERIGNEFYLQPVISKKLEIDLWKGVTIFLGFGVLELVENIRERKKLAAYKGLCEEMLKSGFIN